MNDPKQAPESGGLFAEETEPVKRENPYLKKKKEKSELSAPEQSAPERTSAPARASETDRPRRRTLSDFMFEHVKLITAVITIVLVISLVVATDVVSLVENWITQSEQAGKKPLTLTYVEGLTKKSGAITWKDLEDFARYDQSTATNSVTWFFKVEGTPYEVWISGVSTDKAPTYVKLFDMTTGGELDLHKGNLDKFMEENPLPEN